MGLNKMTKWILVGTVLLLPACGPKGGFSTDTASQIAGDNEGGQGGGDGGGGGGQPTPPPEDEKIDLNGFIAGGTNDRKQVLSLDTEKGELLISLPLGKNISVNLMDTQITKLPGAHIYSSTAVDGNKSLVLAIPLRYVLGDRISTIPPGRLPNGDTLPDMPAGEMPTIAFSVANSNGVKVHLFVGMDAVGLFIESSFNPYLPISYDIISKTQQKVGIFALVPKKGVHQGGFFLGIRLDPALARALDQFIR